MLTTYVTIFVAVLSTILFPVPEEAALLGAGYGARVENLNVLAAGAASLAAVLVGDIMMYFIGRHLLARLLKTRLGRRVLPDETRAWAMRFVSTRGAYATIVARFLVGLRGYVHVAIGASEYPFGRYIVFDMASGAVEVGMLVAVGYAFRSAHGRVGTAVDLTVAAILILTFLIPWALRKRLRSPPPASPPPSAAGPAGTGDAPIA
jgi:membrane-associated protein